MIKVKKRNKETESALIYRFIKRVRQSGILLEVKARQFRVRPQNRTQRRKSALYRNAKWQKLEAQKKYGRAL